MKIIAKVSEDEYILTAYRGEIAQLLGFYSAYDDTFRNKTLSPGTEISIAAMYQQLQNIANSKTDIKEVQAKLRGLADRLEPAVAILPTVILK